MALQWLDASLNGSPSARSDAGGDPWFGITMGLLGIIIGFLLGTFL